MEHMKYTLQNKKKYGEHWQLEFILVCILLCCVVKLSKNLWRENMNIEIVSFTDRTIKAIDVMKLYNDAGWWEERQEKEIENMLEKVQSVGAWKDGTLIGF